MTATLYNFRKDHFPTTVLEWSDIDTKFRKILNSYTDSYGEKEGSHCWRINNTVEKDKVHHFSVNGKVLALNPCQLGFVQAHKCYTKQPVDGHNYNTRYRKRKNKLTISHVCGNSLCINGNHMKIETQSINSQRFKHHNILKRLERIHRRNKNIETKYKKLTGEYFINELSLDDNDENYFVCTHSPVCYIMTGKIIE